MILTEILKMHTEKRGTVHSGETKLQKETHGVPKAQALTIEMGALQGQEEKWGQWARVWAAAESQALPLIAGGPFFIWGIFVCLQWANTAHARLAFDFIAILLPQLPEC